MSSAEYLDSPLRPFSKRIKKTQGKVVPVPKRGNPYVRPASGGGSGPSVTTSPSSPNQAGVNAQIQAQANKAPVSTQIDVNYESDPILARIKALGQQNIGNAETEAAALRRQAVIDTGLADIGGELGLDAATLEAARNNPLSVAARLARESTLRGQQLDESLNQNNLFFSGHRGTQLSELARNSMEEQANLVRDLRAALGGIDQGVLEAREAAALEEQMGMEQVAEAARQQAFNDALLSALGSGAEPMPPEFGQPIPWYEPPPLTPEEELMLSLGIGSSGTFNQFAM